MYCRNICCLADLQLYLYTIHSVILTHKVVKRTSYKYQISINKYLEMDIDLQ